MTDYYDICEDALATLIRSLAQIDEDYQVTQGDDNILSRGVDYAAILRPGTFAPPIFLDDNVGEMSFVIELYLFARYKNELESTENLKAFRSSTINMLLGNPTLNDTLFVTGSSFTTASDFGYVPQKGFPKAPPAFMMQQINVTVDTIIQRSGNEY